MARIEVLNEWFFPVTTLRVNGMIIPAPKEAVEKYRSLKDGWLKDHPKLLHEIPMVSLHPGVKQGEEGYFVKTEILYK